MTIEQKLLHMFYIAHGESTGTCYVEILVDEELDPVGVAMMKNGHAAWKVTKSDLLFDYLTKDMKP